MKRIFLSFIATFIAVSAMAQQHLAFPFQGGKKVLDQFFKDSLKVTDEITAKRATGTVIFKFTADEQGSIKKIIVYYADDSFLIKPVIEALRKSDRKWIIPDGEKMHDFIIPFSINFIAPAKADDKLQKAVYSNYTSRRPIYSTDQVPLDMATLLPAIEVNYSVK